MEDLKRNETYGLNIIISLTKKQKEILDIFGLNDDDLEKKIKKNWR